ncbi:unnamed protein product [Calypogeia fissa]
MVTISSQMGRTPEPFVTEEDGGEVNIIGLVSDTHGVLEEATISSLRRATDTIIHAGDVGDNRYKRRLSAEQVIAKLAKETGKKVIRVAGNVDQGNTELPPWQALEIAGKKIIIIHICGFPPENTADSQDLIKSEAPDIVVFGHSHVPGVQKHGQTLYINPGSAGPRRFKLPRCIAFLSIHKSGEVDVEFVSVGDLPHDITGLPTMYRDPVFTSQGQESGYLCAGEALCEEVASMENLLSNVHYKRRRKCK